MTGLEKLKTDGDIAVYLRNAALAISRLAQEKRLTISMWVGVDGYVSVGFGDYDYTHYSVQDMEELRYYPLGEGSSADDRKKISPRQVCIGGGPKETLRPPESKARA